MEQLGRLNIPERKHCYLGYIIINLKTTREARVGDTVTLKKYFE
jgi:hypothetical protein